MSSGTENRETGQERHPVDLASKTSTMKSSVDPTRSAPLVLLQMQAASQLRNIGTTAVRVQSSSIQTVVTSSTASQVSHIGSGTQMSLKQVPVGIQRSNLPVCTATSAATLVQSGTAVSTRPSIVPATSPLPMQMNAAVAATTYHVPRGAAAVANIAAPRSAVATPIVRATTNLQSTAATQHTGSFSPGLRGLSPSGLLPRAPSPASQGSAWLSGTSIPTTVPKCASPGPLRTPSITTIQQYTQGRSSSMTVTARPLTPQGRMQSESPRPQLVHASPTQKPIAATQTATQSYFKPSVSVQSSLGGVSITQVLPARTQASPLTYSNPLTSTATHFPATASSNQGTTTLIAAQPHQLTLQQGGVANSAGSGQCSATVLTAPTRLTVSSIPGTGLPTQGTMLTASTNQRQGQASNSTIPTASARLAVSTSNQGLGSTQGAARFTVAATGTSQTVNLAVTTSNAGQGTIIASPARLTTLPSSVLTSGQGTAALLTGSTRLTMASNIPGQNAVLSGQTRLQAVSSSVPTAIAACSSQAAVLATTARIAVSATSVAPSIQQGAGLLPTPARLTVSASSSVPSNTGQNALITAPARLSASSNSSITPSPGHQGTTVLATPTRLTVTSGVPNSALAPASVVSLHPVVVSNSGPNLSLKPSSHNQLGASGNRNTTTTHQNLGPKVITQPAHGPSIQITQMPVSSVAGKLPQSLHGVTSLQTAIAITTGATRTVAYTATTTVAASNVSGIRPVTVATPAIPVAKVFPQAAGVGREQIGANSVSEVTLPVHAIQAPQPVQQQQPQPTMVATQQGATSLYIQTSHRTSPAPTSTQAAADRTSTTLPTYTLPATYYYETSSGYQVGSSLVARPYTPASPYTVQTTTAPALRPGVTTHQVHGIMTGAQPVRFNPVMVVDPTRTSMPVHSSFVTEGTLVQAEGSALGQTTQAQPPSKQNASPRPSILRKRDNEGSPLKAQKNLAPVLAALSSGAPVSPPSPRRPDSRGNGGNSSGGSTTISATSSPGLGEGGDDSLPPIKQEPVEESERPPVEMSPRKKPRKQQLTGNELHEPKFSEDEMEFISEEKIKKEAKEDVAYNSHEHPVTEDCEEKIYIPKRPNISLINSYRHTWKSRHNHYLRYSDVKPKDERRPTVTDLANQKQVLQKLNGWKIYHLSTQMEDLSDLEMQVFEKLTAMLKVMEKKTGKELDKDVNRVNELIKGNMQRSKVIKDQMQEAKSQVMKIFDHKSHVADIISRCANKRSFKKREKS